MRLYAGLAALLIARLVAPVDAGAEQVFTVQAAAARATDSTWIGAPATPAAVCIVDTGVDLNDDTARVVERLALGDEPPGDADQAGHHGTLMAMIASAPYNGFGMVGAAPSVNVVSVRVARSGQRGLAFTDLLAGVRVCKQYRDTYNIKVISLSSGAQGVPDPVTRATLENAIDAARAAGISVVAAAGNGGGDPDLPAGYAPVVGVGAATASGGRCDFSASGPGVDLYGPGCPVDAAFPDGRPALANGTSEATAFVAAVLAQLRGLRPDLDASAAEGVLVATARSDGGVPTLDVARAFRVAGLGDALEAGRAAIPGLEPATATQSLTPSASAPPIVPARAVGTASTPTRGAAEPRARRQLAAPRVGHVRHGRGVLSMTVLNRPRGAVVRIDIYARARGAAFPRVVRRLRVKQRRVRVHVRGALTQVTVRYVDPSGRRRSSLTRTVRH